MDWLMDEISNSSIQRFTGLINLARIALILHTARDSSTELVVPKAFRTSCVRPGRRSMFRQQGIHIRNGREQGQSFFPSVLPEEDHWQIGF